MDRGPVAEQDFFLDVDGAKLHGRICRNADAGTGPASAGVIVFHPWAWLGGSMNDVVVSAIYREACKSGEYNTVVRYNVRGTGRSTGRASLGGSRDVLDAVALVQHLLKEQYNPPSRLYVVGYSYGSCIAASVAKLCPEVAGYVSVGFPLGLLSRMFLRSRSHWQDLLAARLPKLLVMGTEDQFTSLAQLDTLVQQYRAVHAADDGAAHMDVRVMEDCDHFFGGCWDEVGQLVMQWVATREAAARVANVAVPASAEASKETASNQNT